ncbi:MAG: DNA-binding protein [Spirochaetales bacterium]|nr:DNA-binding protein [Spirochaetales bacterium]
MNVIPCTTGSKIYTIGFEPGDMLLEKLEKAIKENNIRNGAVISGIGTLKRCRMHYVTHTGFPPKDVIFTLEKPLELLSINGLIIEGKPHLHIVVSRGKEKTRGGHLESGSEVLYLAEVAIMEFEGLHAERKYDSERGINLLKNKGTT